MISFKQHLQERNVQTLYHATSIHNLSSMLQDREIKTSRINNTEMFYTAQALNMAMVHMEKYIKDNNIKGYVSFARHPRNGFTSTNHGAMMHAGWTFATAILKCDGRKIARYGKVIPVDYGAGRKILDGSGSEQEERLLANRQTIPFYNIVTDISVIIKDSDSSWVADHITKLNDKVKIFAAPTIAIAWKNYFRSRP